MQNSMCLTQGNLEQSHSYMENADDSYIAFGFPNATRQSIRDTGLNNANNLAINI